MTIYAILKSLASIFLPLRNTCLSFPFFSVNARLHFVGGPKKILFFNFCAIAFFLPLLFFGFQFFFFDAADSLAAKRHKFTMVKERLRHPDGDRFTF